MRNTPSVPSGCNRLGGASKTPPNKKRKTPASCLVGAFLAIGLSINQTVVSEMSHSSIGELVESIGFGS